MKVKMDFDGLAITFDKKDEVDLDVGEISLIHEERTLFFDIKALQKVEKAIKSARNVQNANISDESTGGMITDFEIEVS